MKTAKQLYTNYMKHYGKFRHTDAYKSSKIDKNTFHRLLQNEFENIKLKDAINLNKFLKQYEPKKG